MIALTSLTQSRVLAQNFAAPYLERSNAVEGDAFGGAYTALASDASATYWNPAGLTQIASYSFTGLVSADLALDRSFNTASAAYTLDGAGTVALSFTQAGVSDIQQFSRDNTFLGNFNTSFMVVGGSYAYELLEGLSVGVTGRFISQDLELVTDQGYHVDLGARFSRDILSVGIVAQNLAGELGPDQLPMNLRAGFGITPLEGLRAAVDFQVRDTGSDASYTSAHLGLGYDFKVNEQITIGAQSGLNDGNFAAGGKLGFVTETLGVQINYAFVNEPSIFGESHRIGITVSGF